jgi:hypothetical protein
MDTGNKAPPKEAWTGGKMFGVYKTEVDGYGRQDAERGSCYRDFLENKLCQKHPGGFLLAHPQQANFCRVPGDAEIESKCQMPPPGAYFID